MTQHSSSLLGVFESLLCRLDGGEHRAPAPARAGAVKRWRMEQHVIDMALASSASMRQGSGYTLVSFPHAHHITVTFTETLQPMHRLCFAMTTSPKVVFHRQLSVGSKQPLTIAADSFLVLHGASYLP